MKISGRDYRNTGKRLIKSLKGVGLGVGAEEITDEDFWERLQKHWEEVDQ